jgi:hypothetical protein
MSRLEPWQYRLGIGNRIWPMRPITVIFSGVASLCSKSFLVLVVCGCQSRGAEYPDMDSPIEVPNRQLAAVGRPPTPRKAATLFRDEVARVIDGGLGRFLQHVEVDASLEHGHFRGFRILRLTPPDYWQGVDLAPGDVVTQVNGMSIERPPEAHRAFVALKTADRLVVSYLRAGEPRELVYHIADRPGTGQHEQPRKPAGVPASKPSRATQSDS